MENLLIKEEFLVNGVTLRLYDVSRKLAGDRWLVALMVKATVPVREHLPSEGTGAFGPDDLIKIKQALDDEVVFEQKRERHFIEEHEKQIVFNQLMDNFVSVTQSYISHPEFPTRFINKCFRDHLARERMKGQRNSSR